VNERNLEKILEKILEILRKQEIKGKVLRFVRIKFFKHKIKRKISERKKENE